MLNTFNFVDLLLSKKNTKHLFYDLFKSELLSLKSDRNKWEGVYPKAFCELTASNSITWLYEIYFYNSQENKDLLIKLNKNLLMTTNYGESLVKSYSKFLHSYLVEIYTILPPEDVKGIKDTYPNFSIVYVSNTPKVLFNPVIEVCVYLFDRSMYKLHADWFICNNKLKYVVQNTPLNIYIPAKTKVYHQKVSGEVTFKYSDFIANYIHHLDSDWMQLSLCSLGAKAIYPYCTIHDSMGLYQTQEDVFLCTLQHSSKEFLKENSYFKTWLDNKIHILFLIEKSFLLQNKFYVCKSKIHRTVYISLIKYFQKFESYNLFMPYLFKFLNINTKKYCNECIDIDWGLVNKGLTTKSISFTKNTLLLLLLLHHSGFLDYLDINGGYTFSSSKNYLSTMGKRVPFSYVLKMFYKALFKKLKYKDEKKSHIQHYTIEKSLSNEFFYIANNFDKLKKREILYINKSLINLTISIDKHLSSLKNKKFTWTKYKKKEQLRNNKTKIDSIKTIIVYNFRTKNENSEFSDIEHLRILIDSMITKKIRRGYVEITCNDSNFFVFNLKGLHNVNKYFLNIFIKKVLKDIAR